MALVGSTGTSKPKKPKKNPAPKKPPTLPATDTSVGGNQNTKTTQQLEKANKVPTPSAKHNAGAGSQPGVKNYGENAPTPSAERNAGAGSNPNIDTKAVSGPRKVEGGFSGAKSQGGTFTVSGKRRTGSVTTRTSIGLTTFSRGGSTIKYGGGSTVTRSGGGGGGGGGAGGSFDIGDRTDDMDIKPPTVEDGGFRVGGGFAPRDLGGPGPAYFDTEGGGAGGGGQQGGATNPLASSLASAFTNASLEDILHGNKKKGRAKRGRRTE